MMLITKIRKMKIADIDSVFSLEESLFDNGWTIAQFQYELNENPISEHFVILKENEIVGYIVFWITFESSTICKVGILPKYQKHGLGTLLMNKMYEVLKKNEVETSTLEVSLINKNAIKFYLSHGYNEVVIKKDYYGEGIDALYMMKVLI